MTTKLSRSLGTFLNTYGGSSYRDHSVKEMSEVLEGFVSILGLTGPDLVIANKLLRKVKKSSTSEEVVFKVSEQMLSLEGMGV